MYIFPFSFQLWQTRRSDRWWWWHCRTKMLRPIWEPDRYFPTFRISIPAASVYWGRTLDWLSRKISKFFFPIWLSCWCCSPGYWQFSSIHNYFIARGIILSGARGRVESVELITGKGLEAITSDANRLATGFEIVRKGINKDNRFQLALAFWIVSTDAGVWGKKFNFYDGVWWILLAGKVLFRNFKQNKSVNSDPESVKKSFLTG